MSKRNIIIIVVLLLFLGGALFFGISTEEEKNEPSVETTVEKSVPFAGAGAEREDDLSEEEAELLERFTPEEIENLKYSHRAAQAANQNVIFYGKCVDQDGNPIAGVQVTAKLTKMRKSMLSVVIHESFKYYEKLTAVTDSDGRFEFVDKGSYLLLEKIEHDGYLEARGPESFGFQFGQILYGSSIAGMHEPDPLEPVVFTMWKKGDGSQAVTRETSFKISKSELGEPTYVDLQQGRRSDRPSSSALEVIARSGGDSRWDPVQFKHVGTGSGFRWSYTLRVPGGGIMRTDDPFLFGPPESGYEESYTFEVPEGEDGWIGRVDNQKFYVKTAGGNYGAVVIDVYSRAEGGVSFYFEKIYYNPTGERDLEHLK